MEFRNLTPFGALCFGAIDPADHEYHVVVMRVRYELRPRGSNGAVGWLDPVVLDEDAAPLVLADLYSGDEGRSSLVCESDLAPFKPRCDVIVTGRARAPEGRPAKRWTAELRIARPRRRHDTEPPPAQGARGLTEGEQGFDVLLDKQIVVHGPRQLRQSWRGSWEMLGAEPAVSVPLAYEHAFGGASLVPAPDPGEAPLLNEVCYQNPLGCGWQDARERTILQDLGRPVSAVLPAPQIELPGDPIAGLYLAEQPRGPLTPDQMLEAVEREPHRPAGLGAVGRAWTPRLQRAGTYDDDWLRDRWPGLPADIDFGYWNGAPEDQQIAYPPPDMVVELVNLTDPATTASRVIAEMPGHRPFVLMRLERGAALPLPMVTDTVHIDTDRLRIDLVHRLWIPVETPIRVLEARFEVDPRAPLVSFAPAAAHPKEA